MENIDFNGVTCHLLHQFYDHAIDIVFIKNQGQGVNTRYLKVDGDKFTWEPFPRNTTTNYFSYRLPTALFENMIQAALKGGNFYSLPKEIKAQFEIDKEIAKSTIEAKEAHISNLNEILDKLLTKIR